MVSCPHDMETTPSNNTPTSTPEKQENFFVEILKFALLAALVVIPFRVFVAEPYIVQGASMSPTFETGHYLIIDKFSHKISGAERGDVVVFKYPNDPNKFFIKRIIGLPGETVSIQDREVSVRVTDGGEFQVLDEPYIKNNTQNNVTTDLGSGEYFVMGDNRGNSSDSRSWGPLDEELIKGTALIQLYPFDHIRLHPGAITNN